MIRQARRAQPPDVAHPVYPDPLPSGDLAKPKTYSYVPAKRIETHWHPYELHWTPTPVSVQRGLVDYALQQPKPMPPRRRDCYMPAPRPRPNFIGSMPA